MQVVVVGAGTMGSGIAQLAAMSGHDTTLVDVDAGQLTRAQQTMATSVGRFVRKQTLTEAQGAEVLRRVASTTDLVAALTTADVVVESVVELLEVKREILRTAVQHAPATALLATNTSQLSITALAGAVPEHADRVVGLHFFNPAVLMKLVEVVAGLETSADTLERAVAFGHSLGKETVVCRKDSPGFLTSRISALVRLECLRMLEEGVASAADIDKALRVGFNWPMGPLELGDYNGLDTYLHILSSLEDTLGERFKPTTTLRNLVSAGRLGRKTGRGIYDYDPAGNIVTGPVGL